MWQIQFNSGLSEKGSTWSWEVKKKSFDQRQGLDLYCTEFSYLYSLICMNGHDIGIIFLFQGEFHRVREGVPLNCATPPPCQMKEHLYYRIPGLSSLLLSGLMGPFLGSDHATVEARGMLMFTSQLAVSHKGAWGLIYLPFFPDFTKQEGLVLHLHEPSLDLEVTRLQETLGQGCFSCQSKHCSDPY